MIDTKLAEQAAETYRAGDIETALQLFDSALGDYELTELDRAELRYIYGKDYSAIFEKLQPLQV